MVVVLNEVDGIWYLIDDAVVNPVALVDGRFPAPILQKATCFLYKRTQL